MGFEFMASLDPVQRCRYKRLQHISAKIEEIVKDYKNRGDRAFLTQKAKSIPYLAVAVNLPLKMGSRQELLDSKLLVARILKKFESKISAPEVPLKSAVSL